MSSGADVELFAQAEYEVSTAIEAAFDTVRSVEDDENVEVATDGKDIARVRFCGEQSDDADDDAYHLEEDIEG